MKRRVLIYLGVFILGGVVSAIYNIIAKNINDTQVCSASVITYNNDLHANLTIDFMYTLEKKTGVVVLNGEYYKNNALVGAIRRDVSYIWTENKDVFHFTSVKVNKIIDDKAVPDEELSKVLPDFYVYPDKSISYSILPQGKHSFMFTVGKRPIFVCSR